MFISWINCSLCQNCIDLVINMGFLHQWECYPPPSVCGRWNKRFLDWRVLNSNRKSFKSCWSLGQSGLKKMGKWPIWVTKVLSWGKVTEIKVEQILVGGLESLFVGCPLSAILCVALSASDGWLRIFGRVVGGRRCFRQSFVQSSPLFVWLTSCSMLF